MEQGTEQTWQSLTTLALKFVIHLDTQHYYSTSIKHFNMYTIRIERLCGLIVRVPGYRSGGLGLDSWCYQIFWEIVGLEWGLLSLVSTTEELLGRDSSGSGLENQEYCHRVPLHWPCDTLYLQKLALTSPTSSGCSVGTVRSQTKSTEFVLFVCYELYERRKENTNERLYLHLWHPHGLRFVHLWSRQLIHCKDTFWLTIISTLPQDRCKWSFPTRRNLPPGTFEQ
jgi:hypothetical protein